MKITIEKSSFRDRDGFVFYHEGEVYRKINESYIETFNDLEKKGIYSTLIQKKWLVPYKSEDVFFEKEGNKCIKQEKIPFISYPYEWSFFQLKRAAILTLNIQLYLLENNYTLKDASAFNIQFNGVNPIFIDTLSFEKYNEGEPWHAYKQFCQHFFAPLILQMYNIEDISRFANIEGIPLELCSKILPYKSRWNISVWMHIHLNAKFEKKHRDNTKIKNKKIIVSKSKITSIIKHLLNSVENIKLPKTKTNWTDYYSSFSYDSKNFDEKKNWIEENLKLLKPNFTVDCGSNTGVFSEIASNFSKYVISFDFDSFVIQNQCIQLKKKKINNILPLIQNLNTPSPSIGWMNEERSSFLNRLPKNSTVLVLALIHHLVLSNNISFKMIAEFFSKFSENLIIEYVPKSDPQSQRLLITKKDIFDDYTIENFEETFSKYFNLTNKNQLTNSTRILYNFKIK